MSINISRKLLTGTGIVAGCMAGYISESELLRIKHTMENHALRDKLILNY